MDIIIPCAGLSTRYPNTLPKYVLSCYDGKMVLENIVNKYLEDNHRVHITILKEHDIKFNIIKRLKYIFQDKINITILTEKTKGSAETVYLTLKQNNIKNSFLVRDCDSFFEHEIDSNHNAVYCSHINNNENLLQKSYVEFNQHNIVTNIVEKNIISEYFCVGGYQFFSAEEFIDTYNSLTNYSKEIYISNIISDMISNSFVFLKEEVQNYIDLNDLEAFDRYNNKPTYFCDIDGVVCKIISRYDDNPFEKYSPIEENIAALIEEQSKGCKIIFTTARCKKFYKQTESMLINMGFKNFELLMEMGRSKRVVINDYDRIYPTATAICIKSESTDLKKFIDANYR